MRFGLQCMFDRVQRDSPKMLDCYREMTVQGPLNERFREAPHFECEIRDLHLACEVSLVNIDI